jgi:hypothetical protein
MTTAISDNSKSPREEINEVIEFGKILLAASEIPVGRALMHTRRAKSRLTKIFGESGAHISLFQDPPALSTEAKRRGFVAERNELLERIASRLDCALRPLDVTASRIFIGHGRSPLWRELKDFISERLCLGWEEFNSTSAVGFTTSERLHEMLDQAVFAFLIMTAEDEHLDATVHARANVIHEVGLFQGRLGLRRAIVLLEEGCSEFSNITGLVQIRFPPGRISAVFEEVRSVLEREGII